MVAMSFTRGTRCRVTGSSVNRQAASAGSDEFLEPLTGISPLKGVPPTILNLSISTYFVSASAARSRLLDAASRASASIRVSPNFCMTMAVRTEPPLLSRSAACS